MKLSRVCALLLVALFVGVGSVSLDAGSAHAASKPPPVVPLPAPGDYVTKLYESNGNYPNGSPGSPGYAEWRAQKDAELDDALRAQGRYVDKTTGQVHDLPGAKKPNRIISGVNKVSRTAAGKAGLIGLAAQFGWAIGQGGIALYATATGDTYESVMCDQPEWYQGINSVAMFDLGPTCTSELIPEGGYQVERATSEKCIVLPTTSVPDPQRPMLCRSPFAGFRVNMPNGKIDSYLSTPLSNAAYKAVPAGNTLLPVSLNSGYRYVVYYRGVAGLTETTPVVVPGGGNQATTNDSWNTGVGTIFRVSVPGSVHSDNPVVSEHAWQENKGGVWKDLGADKMSTAPGKEAELELECTVDWSDGTTSTGKGSKYLESESMPVSASAWGCADIINQGVEGGGKWPSKISVGTGKEGASSKDTVHETELPPTTPEEREALTSPSPKGLELWKGAQSCMTWEADCKGWWVATSSGANPGTFKCTFGGANVSLTQCSPYRTTFEDSSQDTTIKPELGSDRDVKWLNENDWLNSVDPGDTISPAGTCMKGWGAAPDPISWVMHPVKCAMVWAFVPRQSVVDTKSNEMIKAWEPTMPGQIVDAATVALTPPEGTNGCTGPHVYIPMTVFGNTITIDFWPLWACDGAGAQFAALSRTISAAILLYLTVLGVVRRASATVNAPGVGAGAS